MIQKAFTSEYWVNHKLLAGDCMEIAVDCDVHMPAVLRLPTFSYTLSHHVGEHAYILPCSRWTSFLAQIAFWMFDGPGVAQMSRKGWIVTNQVDGISPPAYVADPEQNLIVLVVDHAQDLNERLRLPLDTLENELPS